MHKIKYRLLTFLYGLIILVVNSIPGDEIPLIRFPYFDKIVHFGIYFGFGFFLLMAVIEHLEISGWRSIGISIFIGTLFGAIDEFHQYVIPRRIPSFYDFSADALGVILGTLFMFILIMLKYIKIRLR